MDRKPLVVIPGLALLAAVLAVFGPFLSPQTHWVISAPTEDIATQYLWWRKFGFEEFAKGHLALWDPYLFCGMPYFGNLQAGLLYPFNWFYLFFPLAFATNLFFALHTFLAGFFTYLWIARRGLSVTSAFLGGFILMFGASFFLRIIPGHILNLSTLVWVPLILLAVDSCARQEGRSWVVLGALAVGLQVLAANLQLCYYTGLFAAVYALLTVPAKSKWSFFVKVGLMFGVGYLLGAVQILTAMDTAPETLRGAGLPADLLEAGLFRPERLWCLLVPNFFGSTYSGFWGGGSYWEGVVYISLSAFTLVLLTLVLGGDRMKWVLGGLALGVTAICAVKIPFRLCVHFLPMFGHFRGPAKLDFWITLCLALLAAMGWEEVLKSPGALKSLGKGTGRGAVAASVLLALFEVFKIAKAKWTLRFSAHLGDMEKSLLICAGLLILLWVLCRIGQRRPLARYGIFLLALLELFVYAKNNLPSFDLSAYTDAHLKPLEETYQKDPGDYRVLASIGNYALGVRAYDLWGYDTAVPARYCEFMNNVQGWDPYTIFSQKSYLNLFPPALELTRLRYVYSEQEGVLKPRRMNWKEAPRVFLADHWSIHSASEALKEAAKPGFDWRHQVLLEVDPQLAPSKTVLKGSVQCMDINSDTVEVTAKVNKPALLVMTDNYSRGWKAMPLGATAQTHYQVLPADGFARGIPLQAGEHHFVMQYHPQAFVIGSWISWIAWFLFIGTFFVTIPMSRRP